MSAAPCLACNRVGYHTANCAALDLQRRNAERDNRTEFGCAECGCYSDQHSTWCNHWVRYENKEEKKEKKT